MTFERWGATPNGLATLAPAYECPTMAPPADVR